MSAHDAREAVDQGADAVYVSNHGGRQLDSVAGTAEVLPEVVEAVDGRAEVLVDGGIRRGADVVKAGPSERPPRWVAVRGSTPWPPTARPGVNRLLEIVKADVDRTLALIGVPRFDDVDGSVLRPTR